MASLVNFTKFLEKNEYQCLPNPAKIEEEEKFCNSLYQASITPISNPDKDITHTHTHKQKRKNNRSIFLMDRGAKILCK